MALVMQMRPQRQRTAARLRSLVAIGIAVLGGATLLGSLLLMVFFARAEESLDVAAESLETVEETIDLTEGVLASSRAGLSSLSLTAEQAADGTSSALDAVDEASEVLGEELPASVEAIREAMPGLIDAASVIDSTLGGLALFGVPYDPDTPLDEAFQLLDRRLAPLPSRLRSSAGSLSVLSSQSDAYVANLRVLGLEIGDVAARLQEADVLFGSYRDNVEAMAQSLESTREGMGLSRLLAWGLLILVATLGAIFLAALRILSNLLDEGR